MANFDMPSSGTWEQRGGWVVLALRRDLNLTAVQAAGLVGNLGFESRGFTALHEDGQMEGQGGYGWAQWTADRRRTFFAWCATNKLLPNSDEANYGYLLQELRTTYFLSTEALKKCADLSSAVFSVGITFERPAGTTGTYLPAFAERKAYATSALRGSTTIPWPGAEPTAPPAPEADPEVIPADLITFDMVKPAIQNLQTWLRLSGDYDGSIDGIAGPTTAKALQSFQSRTKK